MIGTKQGGTSGRRRLAGPDRVRITATLALLFLTTWAPHRARASDAWALLSTPAFETAARREGLPHPVITSVAQDGAGFIWVGTQGGLARYDGFRFQSYTADAADPLALPDSYILALQVDSAGRLWIGTAGGGAAWYDPVRDAFVRVPVGATGIPSATVPSITDDGTGGVWIGSRSGITHVPADGPTESFTVEAGHLPRDQLNSLLRGRDGTLWVGTQTGLLRRPAGEGRFEAVPLGMGGQTRVLHEDRNGQIWISAPDGGQDRLYVAGGGHGPMPVAAKDAKGQPLLFPPGAVIDLEAGANGHLWIALQRSGIIDLDLSDGSRRLIQHDPADRASLPDNAVNGFQIDRAGFLWIATRNGLARINPANAKIQTIRYSPLQPDRLSGADAMSLHVAPDGSLLVGLIKGGIDRLHPVHGRMASYTTANAGLPDAAIHSLLTVGDSLYVGTGQGLVRMEGGQAGPPIPLPGTDPLPQTLLHWRGQLWIGTRAALVRLDVRTGAAERFQCGPLPYSQNVLALTAGPDGRLWAGTPTGLDIIDVDRCEIERLRNDPADPGTVPSGVTSALLFDSRGRLWMGTLGSGLAVGTGQDGRWRFRRFGTADGLPNANIGSIVEDRNGQIWLSTANGIAAVTPDFRIRAYGSADGASIASHWVRAGELMPAGDIVFGGGGGLTVVRAGPNLPRSTDPPVVVTAVRIGNNTYPPGALNLPGKAGCITLPSGSVSLQVEFSALDYAAPERTRYRYRLEGFEAGWTETDPARRTAAYTNLPPGDYTLQIEGTDRSGAWSRNALRIPVHVLPDWHQTQAFRVGIIVLVLGAVATLVQVRTRLIRSRQRQLVQEVEERTRELVAANRQLAALASTDPLTGVLNRRRFLEVLDNEVERAIRYGQKLCLLELDLDHFKQVNDRYGHAGGDAVLCVAVARIAAQLRKVDVLGRLGGEEFAVLLPMTGIDGARQAASRIREAVAAAPILYLDQPIGTTVSIGCAQWQVEDETADALLLRADQALYAAKLLGRNRVEVWTPDLAGRFAADTHA